MNIQGRLNRVDEARGFTLISMILYHFMWDLKYIALFDIDWYTGPIGYIWQKSICISFIFISGFCFSFGKKRFKRSLLVFICGILITAVTLIIMPENRIIFGILTFLGTAGIITIPIDRLHVKLEQKLSENTLNITMMIGTILLFIAFFNVNYGFVNIPAKFIVPKYMYSGYVATFLGFPDPLFFSTDYFALLPWIFLYLCGYYSQRVFKNYSKIIEYFRHDTFSQVSFIGRKSLIIYMLHQPVLYLITIILIRVR